MADRNATPNQRRQDGFTLIEVLIVVSMIAMITLALAAVVTVVLRTAPPAEARAEDARSVQGLVTWLPQDIDAAPPGGFNRDPVFWPCGGSAPADSHNIISAGWTESTGILQRFAATYRYERAGDEWRMVRYECQDSGTGTMGAGIRNNLTSELPPWNATTPPAWVTMCRSAVTAGATCPSADVIPDSDLAPVEVHSLKLFVTRVDGVVATIDAAPKNPDQDLADDPNASLNLPPVLSQSSYTLQMFAGDSVTIDIMATHGISDAESDPVSAAIDSTEPLPTGISALASDPTLVTVTADPTLMPGLLSPSIVVIVSDNQAGWVDALIRVEILPEPNFPPTVSQTDYLLQMTAGQTVVVPLGTTHNVLDPNGDPLTVTVVSHPAGLTNPPQPDRPGPLDLEVKVPGIALPGVYPTPIVLEISDGRGGVVTATVTVEVVLPSVNQAPVAATPNLSLDLFAGDSVSLSLVASHGVSDPDGDPLSITDDDAPTGVTVTLDGALNVTITTDLGLPVGPIAVPVQFEVSDIHGEHVDVTVTINIIPTPPPPSDCVLGALSASPASVDRQGGGTQAHLLKNDVVVTITYTGTCDGLTLTYDTGDTTGLGIGAGRVFPPGSPSSVVIVGKNTGGTEKWTPGPHLLTATTTSAVSPNSTSTTLTVN